MNVLGKNYNFIELLKYTLPTIMMMVLLSSYTIIDGMFVATLVGESALASINIIVPIFNIILSIGLMFSTGGTAIIGRLMGQNKNKEAREFLSLLYIIASIVCIIFSIIILVYSNDITRLLGADSILYKDALDYLITVGIFGFTLVFQCLANSLLVAAGKPTLGFILGIISGLTNIILDYIFISPNILNMGISGAGYATGIANSIPAITCTLYFIFNRKQTLYFFKPSTNIILIFKACYNGMSELVGQLSIAITTFMFNIILYYFALNDGIKAITIILYIQMLQQAIFTGYNLGVAPIISYKYGEQNHDQLKSVISISLRFLSGISIIVIIISIVFSKELTMLFLSVDSSAFSLSVRGLSIISLSYIFMSYNLFISNLFTSLSNGHISALLAISRSLIFMVICLIVLPYSIGIDGVWLAPVIAELFGCILSYYIYNKFRYVYNY